jgi:hypothetical protein|tara:strand:- start:364 stop:618 length:255 start_codon:yes stop_codon:yes gene_type:complete
MRITKRQLRRIIREVMRKEQPEMTPEELQAMEDEAELEDEFEYGAAHGFDPDEYEKVQAPIGARQDALKKQIGPLSSLGRRKEQ